MLVIMNMELFFDKIYCDPITDCWLWLWCVDKDGYR
jgi:hypothetical protein